MPGSCCVPGCKDHELAKSIGIPFHRFPVNDKIRRGWLVRVKNPGLSVDATTKALQSYRVCGKHFLPSDYERDMYAEIMKVPARHLLRKDAMPSVFPFFASSPTTSTTKAQGTEGHEVDVNRSYEQSSQCPMPATSAASPCTEIGNDDSFELELKQEPVTNSVAAKLSECLMDSQKVGYNLECDGVNIGEDATQQSGEECYIKQEVIEDEADQVEVGYLVADCLFLPTEFEIECDEDDTSVEDEADKRFPMMHAGITADSYFVSEQSLDTSSDLDPHRHERPYNRSLCGESFERRSHPAVHNRIHAGERPYKCCVCEKSFIESCDLTVLSRSHSGERAYTCNVCRKSFKQIRGLNVHPRTHAELTPYKCSVRSGNLHAHNESLRSEKPCKCGVCGKSFKQSGNLSVQKQNHTDDKPFKCSVCGKYFKQNSQLILHLTTHTSEKPYSCTTCGRSFKQKYALAYHMEIHTGVKRYKCNVCGMSFKNPAALVVHSRMHIEKPYKCAVCGKVFKRIGHLLVHSRTHSSERPYNCGMCKKS